MTRDESGHKLQGGGEKLSAGFSPGGDSCGVRWAWSVKVTRRNEGMRKTMLSPRLWTVYLIHLHQSVLFIICSFVFLIVLVCQSVTSFQPQSLAEYK